MQKKAILFGYLGTVEEKFNGQSIRTKNVKKLLEDNLNYEVDVYDTQRLPLNPFTILPALYRIRKADKVFMLPAHRGLKILLPLLVIISRFFKKEIYHIAIGGWLPVYLERYKYLNFFMKKITMVFVQTDVMAAKLRSTLGSVKIELLPNFKFYTFNREFDVTSEELSSLKVVYISRVCKEKGLDTVESLMQMIEDETLPVSINLYGPVAPEDDAYLKNILLRFSKLSYKGIAKAETIFDTLSEYDVMLFPTHHMTEGFPGVILDAYISGLPIVASNWDYSSQFVTNDLGFIYDHDKPREAFIYLRQLLENPKLLTKMQLNSYERRNMYSANSISSQLKKLGF